MAVNLASKYSTKVDERFRLKSLTESACNRDYDWNGVNAITIYSVPTVPMNDYTKSGTARYGAAAELDNTVQTLTLAKDRSFTFTIDQGNRQDTQMVMDAGKALARQIDEVITPEIDIYRLSVIAAAADANGGDSAIEVISASNAYSALLDAQSYFSNNKVPMDKRIAFITPSYYKFLKLDNNFIKASDIGQNLLINGQVGQVDGVKIVLAPSTYFPASTDFLLVHPSATVCADKLQDYKIHQNPPGINGYLCEGRIRYDAFVLANKVKAVYRHKNA